MKAQEGIEFRATLWQNCSYNSTISAKSSFSFCLDSPQLKPSIDLPSVALQPKLGRSFAKLTTTIAISERELACGSNHLNLCTKEHEHRLQINCSTSTPHSRYIIMTSFFDLKGLILMRNAAICYCTFHSKSVRPLSLPNTSQV